MESKILTHTGTQIDKQVGTCVLLFVSLYVYLSVSMSVYVYLLVSFVSISMCVSVSACVCDYSVGPMKFPTAMVTDLRIILSGAVVSIHMFTSLTMSRNND